MASDWAEQETGTHQDHVTAHVIGATVLGYFTADEAAHLLLDIGFIWSVYLDCEMGLVPQTMALAELASDEEERARLNEDVRRLHDAGSETEALSRFTPAPGGCLMTEVLLQARGDERRLLINCEEARLVVETSHTTGEIRIYSA